MKRGILLNSEITSTIAAMGHTDSLTVSDAGLPISCTVKRIDLAVKAGIPSFIEVLETILEELCIEKVTLAEEIKTVNPRGLRDITDLLTNYEKQTGFAVKQEFISHEEFKVQTSRSKAIVRTGEVKPYANIILHSGVVF